MNESRACLQTAPATPGLLNSYSNFSGHQYAWNQENNLNKVIFFYIKCELAVQLSNPLTLRLSPMKSPPPLDPPRETCLPYNSAY